MGGDTDSQNRDEGPISRCRVWEEENRAGLEGSFLGNPKVMPQPGPTSQSPLTEGVSLSHSLLSK